MPTSGTEHSIMSLSDWQGFKWMENSHGEISATQKKNPSSGYVYQWERVPVHVCALIMPLCFCVKGIVLSPGAPKHNSFQLLLS